MKLHHWIGNFVAFVCVAVLTGCGSQNSGRYDVRGTVSYDERPLPIGNIVFNADHQAGNAGPQGRALISDGRISIQDGMGTVGGAQWLQITGFDGKAFKDNEGQLRRGKPLFPMLHQQTQLPEHDMELRITISRPTSADERPLVTVQILE